MLVKNTAARLITISSPRVEKLDDDGKVVETIAGRKFNLLPAGKAVDVTEEACKSSAKFLYALLMSRDVEFDKGQLDEIVGDDLSSEELAEISEPFEIPEQYLDMSKEDLTLMAQGLGLVVPKRWTIEKIVIAIEEVSEG